MTSPIIRALALPALLALATLPVAAQQKDKDKDKDKDRDREEYESKLDTTVAFDRNGTVELSLSSGEIRVTAWERREVKVSAVTERGLLRFDATGSRLELSVRSRGGRSGETRYEVTVPVGTRVDMNSVSGDLLAAGVKGEIEANTVSGEIEVTDAQRVSLASVSGSVVVRGATGEVRASSVSGDVELERVAGDVEMHTVSGEVALRDVRAKFLRARSTSGDVEFDGTIDPAGRYDFGSHSGTIRLMLPSAVSAAIEVETYSGEVDSDFPIRLEPGEHSTGRPRRLQFRIGGGGARVSAETFSGDIDIRRAGGARDER
jgi:hypothetical protein